MKNRLLRLSAILIAGMLLVGFESSSAFAQRVNAYIVTTPTLTWTDISGTGTNIYSVNYNGHGAGILPYYQSTTTTLPFAFKYDNTTVASGTTLYISGSSISIGLAYNANYITSGGLGNGSYPALLCPYAGVRSDIGGKFWSNNGIWTQVTGTVGSRVFTIQMNNVHTPCISSSSTGSSIQIKIFETGIIQFLYQTHGATINGACGTYYNGSTGLNGYTSPSFASVTEVSNSNNTPTTDYQFSPIPPPELSLQPKSLTLGPLPVGSSTTGTVTVKSVGGSPLTIQSYAITGGGAADFTVVSGPAPGTQLAIGASAQYTIKFTPTNGSTNLAQFTVVTNGSDSGTQAVSLTGNGLAPNVSYGVTAIFHKTRVPLHDTSGVQYIPITNIGNYPLVVNSIYFIGLDAADYFISRYPATIIGPDVTDSIGIRFAPRIEGVPDAQVVISTNALNIPWDTVGTFGIGTLERLDIDNMYSNRVTLNFDSVAVGTQACMPVMLYNPGSDTLKILQNFFASADYDFSYTPINSTDSLITPNDSEMIQVCFTPLKRGYRTAGLQFVTAIPLTFTQPPLDTGDFLLTLIGTGVPTGNFSITGPDNIDTIPVGQTVCQTDTLWNTGEADLTVTKLMVTGPNSSEFVPNLTLPLTLAAGTHETFTTCATPAGINDRVGMLVGMALAGEKADTAQLGLDVYGVSICTSDSIATNLPALTCVGDTSFATILVTNCGNVTTPYTATITGTNAADFRVVGSATSPSEASGGMATFTVAFAPTTNGSETATFTIAGGNGGTVPLTGMGGEATIAGSNSAAAQVGMIDTFSVNINNTGTCDWTPGTPTLPAGSVFSYVSGGTTAIAAGGTAPMSFAFAPTSAGNFGPVAVTFNSAVGTASSVAVTLNGVASSSSVSDVSSQGYSLGENYPNPFSGKSSVEIALPTSSMVQLVIVDVTGKVVQTVLDQRMDAGTFQVTLDASSLASGTYYYQLMAGGVTLTRQMMVIK